MTQRCPALLVQQRCVWLPAGFGDDDVYLQGNIWEQYLLCYYWTVATLTTNGQIGDMGPKCMLEVRTLSVNPPPVATQWVPGACRTLHAVEQSVLAAAWANHLEATAILPYRLW